MSQSIEQFVFGSGDIPDITKIESHIAEIRANQTVVEHHDFDRLLEEMIARMGMSSPEHRRWISGKWILLPLMIRLLRRHTNRSIGKESLCFRLAKTCEFPGLAELRERILAVA